MLRSQQPTVRSPLLCWHLFDRPVQRRRRYEIFLIHHPLMSVARGGRRMFGQKGTPFLKVRVTQQNTRASSFRLKMDGRQG